MAIDIEKERLIDLQVALRQVLPRVPHKSTVWRWVRKGVGGVKLEVVYSGRRLLTSIEAVHRFLHRTSVAPITPSTAHQQQILGAKQKLQSARIA